MELQVDTGLPGNTYFGRLVTPDGGYVGAENSTKLWYDEDSEEIRIGYGSDYSRFLKDGSAVFNDVTGDSLTLSGKMTADSLSAGPSVSDFSGNVLVSDGVKLYTAAGPALTFDDADNQLEVTGGTFTVAGTIQATGLTTPAGGVGIELLWVAATSRAYIQAYDRNLSQYKSMYFAGSEIVLTDSGANRLKIDGNIYIGDAGVTNYFQIDPDGDASWHGTARIDWSKKTASTVTLDAGSSGNVVADLQTAFDGNTYDISEAAATPGIDLKVDFVSITAFNWVQILARYDGSSTHSVSIQLYNWSTTAWDTFDSTDGTQASMHDHSFFVPDDANYIGTGGDAGKVRVRFNHTMLGNASHDMYIDVVALYQ